MVSLNVPANVTSHMHVGVIMINVIIINDCGVKVLGNSFHPTCTSSFVVSIAMKGCGKTIPQLHV